MSTQRIETFSMDRDFILNPAITSDIYTGIRIRVTLYQFNGSADYDVIREHFISEIDNGKVKCGETIEDSHETYHNLEEAFGAFSVQCVKAFTQQVTWYNSQDKIATEEGK